MNVEYFKQKYCADKGLLELSRSSDPKDKETFKKYSEQGLETYKSRAVKTVRKDNKIKRLMHEYMAKETQSAIDEIKKVRSRADAKLKAYESNSAISLAAKKAESTLNTLLSLIQQNLKAIPSS